MEEKSPFYMIYVDGQSSPTYKHPTPQSAEAEAKRLAELFPNKEVFILQTVKSYKVPDRIITTIYKDDLPF